MAGVVYDSNEVSRMESFLNKQNDIMEQVDKETQVKNKSILRYAVILGGVAIVLVLFKVLVDKKK